MPLLHSPRALALQLCGMRELCHSPGLLSCANCPQGALTEAVKRHSSGRRKAQTSFPRLPAVCRGEAAGKERAGWGSFLKSQPSGDQVPAPRHPWEALASVSPTLAESPSLSQSPPPPRLPDCGCAHLQAGGSWPPPPGPSNRRVGPYLQAMACFLASDRPALPSRPSLRKPGHQPPRAAPRGSLQRGDGKGKHDSPGINTRHILVSAGRAGMEWQ